MTTTSAEAKRPGGTRVHVQRFGTFLSGMIMPNIPALIAWGIFTAFFIGVGTRLVMGCEAPQASGASPSRDLVVRRESREVSRG